MFDQLRESIRALSDRLAPEERRRVVSAMREAMVHAKLGLQDLREGMATTEARLRAERTELETVRRRQGLAAQIGDNETVAIAERFATQHAERVAVLESKLMVQQQELSLADRELDDMANQLRLAASGIAPGGTAPGGTAPGGTAPGGVSAETAARREVEDFLVGADEAPARGADAAAADIGAGEGAGRPRRTRAEREAEAEGRLADLKRRMGK